MWNFGSIWSGMGFAHGYAFWILLFAGAVAAGVWLANPAQPDETKPAQPQSAMDILKLRYAKGEIGREEFELMKRDLQA